MTAALERLVDDMMAAGPGIYQEREISLGDVLARVHQKYPDAVVDGKLFSGGYGICVGIKGERTAYAGSFKCEHDIIRLLAMIRERFALH